MSELINQNVLALRESLAFKSAFSALLVGAFTAAGLPNNAQGASLDGSFSVTVNQDGESAALGAYKQFDTPLGAVNLSFGHSELPTSLNDSWYVSGSFSSPLARSQRSILTFTSNISYSELYNTSYSSETLSAKLSYGWLGAARGSNNAALSVSKKRTLHSTEIDRWDLSYGKGFRLGEWSLSGSISIGGSDGEAFTDDHVNYSFSGSKAIAPNLSLQVGLGKQTVHQRRYIYGSALDIYNENDYLSLDLAYQLGRGASLDLNVTRAMNETKYFTNVLDDYETTWSVSLSKSF